MKSTLWVFVVFFLTSTHLYSLEIQKGKIKVVFNERNGRFSLFASNDIKEPRQFHPLYSAKDPTSSVITVFFDGKTYSLGDTRAFTLSQEATPNGFQAVWTNNDFKIIQKLEFISSLFSGIADGVKLSFLFQNLSHVMASQVGLKILLDTNLGEQKDHFLLSTGEEINVEKQIESNMPDFVISPSSANQKLGFMLMLGKGTSPPPNEVTFANWKKLKESSWDFVYHAGRSYNLLPYSYNDSAIVLSWTPKKLLPKQNDEIAVMMGISAAKTFVKARVNSDYPLQDILDGLRSLNEQQNKDLELDIFFFDELLKHVDQMIKAPQNITATDLRLAQEIAEELTQREIKNSYGRSNH